MPNMIDNIENMNKKTKMILSAIGVCAVVVPAILLWIVSSNSRQEPEVDNSSRPVSGTTLTAPTVRTTPTPVVVTPAPATNSAVPQQGTSSAQ